MGQVLQPQLRYALRKAFVLEHQLAVAVNPDGGCRVGPSCQGHTMVGDSDNGGEKQQRVRDNIDGKM